MSSRAAENRAAAKLVSCEQLAVISKQLTVSSKQFTAHCSLLTVYGLLFCCAIVLLLCCSTALFAGEKKPVKPSLKDKCPVCGMFVAKYPDWVAEIIFKDGSYAFFDGAKDMFKYYFNMAKYNPSKNQSDIDSIYVTDYYNLTLIDGYRAYYVEGSNVYGPMGKELIPFEKEEDAKGFMKDHKGKKILRFKDLTPEVLHRLE